ncbi:MAG: hypothetical protein AAF196_12100 [Planctomycetota bacterium]
MTEQEEDREQPPLEQERFAGQPDVPARPEQDRFCEEKPAKTRSDKNVTKRLPVGESLFGTITDPPIV